MKSNAKGMVSIIIPVYNVAPYIEDCLRSVMRQTYKGAIECIIVDDCGTDDSIAIAERLIASYKGQILFRIVHHEHNRGLSAARNTGIEVAKGEYVFFFDSDDEITEDCIGNLMVPVLRDPTIEMVQGNVKLYGRKGFDPYTRKFPIKHTKSNEEVRACFYKKNQAPGNAWNKLIKRSVLVQDQLLFKEGLLWEDTYWLFFLLKYLNNVYYVSDITYIHKRRPGSIVTSTDIKTFAKHRFIFYRDVLTNLTPQDERAEMRFILMDFTKQYMRFHRELPEYGELFFLFWKKAKEHRGTSQNVILALCYILGMTRWGWMVIPFQKRLRHPGLVLHDF